jgi:hypothetical protein
VLARRRHSGRLTGWGFPDALRLIPSGLGVGWDLRDQATKLWDRVIWQIARGSVDAVRYRPNHLALVMACGCFQPDAPSDVARWVIDIRATPLVRRASAFPHAVVRFVSGLAARWLGPTASAVLRWSSGAVAGWRTRWARAPWSTCFARVRIRTSRSASARGGHPRRRHARLLEPHSRAGRHAVSDRPGRRVPDPADGDRRAPPRRGLPIYRRRAARVCSSPSLPVDGQPASPPPGDRDLPPAPRRLRGPASVVARGVEGARPSASRSGWGWA